MGNAGRRRPNSRLRGVAVDDDFGMAHLRTAWLQDTGCIVGIVAPDGADIVNVRNIGDHREPGHGPGMAIATGFRELASRNALPPIGWFEVMEVALRDRHIVVIILQLSLTVIVE